MTFRPSLFMSVGSGLLALALALPVLALLSSWLHWDVKALQILGEMWDTVLPDYALTSALLCLLVGAGVIVLGAACATAVALFDFPLRRFFEWALLLPMAIPAYVVAYAYTDYLQFSGPFQSAMRELWGVQGRVFPEIRNVWGAAFVFTMALYPYVYLLVRTALTERANHLMEAARLLGASMSRRVMHVALPLARPALAAGAALALMETLADYGVSSYFGIQTFTAGVYKAWLAMDNPLAASQLATMLLILVLMLLGLERRAQSRMRFATARVDRQGAEAQPYLLKGRAAWLAVAVCAVPIVLGFFLPVAFMLRALLQDETWTVLSWGRFLQWSWTSVSLGLITASLAVAIAFVLGAQVRLMPGVLTRWVQSVVSLGYAVPGAVVVVGLLLPVTWVQARWPQVGVGYWMTATVMGLIWAYLVRFVSVAMQSVQSGYTRMPASMDDSARMLGVAGWALLVRVHWPLLRRPLTAAGLLVLVDVMKELPATLVLRPFDTDTLAVVAYQLARDERLGEAALPSLALVLAGLIPVVLLSRTLRRS